MSRTRKPAVDAALSAYWQRAVSERRAFEIGIVIGQISATGVADALLTGIPVPSESDILDMGVAKCVCGVSNYWKWSTEDEDARSFDDVSIDWVQEYAKQIDRLLPGGISIIGLYVVSAAPARATFDHATFYLRAAIEALSLPSAFNFPNPTNANVHYVVHVCPNTNKTSAKSVFSLLDAAKSDAIPAELRGGGSADALALKKFTTTVAIDERIAFEPPAQLALAVDAAAEKVLDAVQQQLLPLVQRVQSAMGILRNRGGADKSESIGIQLISAMATAPADEQEKSRAGRVRGAISCVAYVLASELHAHEAAVAYLKQDFVMSLLLRVELVRERNADDGVAARGLVALREGGDVALPKRASLPWLSSLGLCAHFPALLHVLQDEHASTDSEQELAVQNALEILGAKETSEVASLAFLESDAQLYNNKSNKPSESKASQAIASTAKSCGSSNNNNVLIAFAVLFVLLAIVAQQLMAVKS